MVCGTLSTNVSSSPKMDIGQILVIHFYLTYIVSLFGTEVRTSFKFISKFNSNPFKIFNIFCPVCREDFNSQTRFHGSPNDGFMST